MPIIHWKPFQALDELLEEGCHVGSGDFAIDVCEENGNIIVEMNMAGIDPDKVDVDIEEHHIRISGTREEKKERKDHNFYKKEIRRGSFERIVSLPCAVDASQARAEIENGMLVITLPKLKHKASSKVKVSKK